MKCSICGKSLSFKAGSCNDKYRTNGFQCLGYRRGEHKGSQYISEKKLTAAVLQSLQEVLSNIEDCSFDLIRTTYTDAELDLAMYENELKLLENKYKRIREAYLNEIDTLDEYKSNKAILDQRMAELETLIANLSVPSSSPEDYREQFLASVRSVISVIESDAPYELKGEALRSICSKIVFTKEALTLEFFYHLIV